MFPLEAVSNCRDCQSNNIQNPDTCITQEHQSAANLLLQSKSALVAALEEQKSVADSEARERQSLLGKYRNTEHEAEGLRQQHEEVTQL